MFHHAFVIAIITIIIIDVTRYRAISSATFSSDPSFLIARFHSLSRNTHRTFAIQITSYRRKDNPWWPPETGIARIADHARSRLLWFAALISTRKVKEKKKKRINYTRYVHTTEIARGKWNVLSLIYIFIFLIATKDHIKWSPTTASSAECTSLS